MTEGPTDHVAGKACAPAEAPKPSLRPGRYDPADYAGCVLTYAAEAGISPTLLMAILHNEAYKPHHPLLEWLWQRWKPKASFGLGNMHEATFEQVRRAHGLSCRWKDLRDDPALAIRAAALHLGDLRRGLPARTTRSCTRDELLALGYNAGERNMRLFAQGFPAGPMARSYLRRLRENWRRAERDLQCGTLEQSTTVVRPVEP
ncbi:transglycosylase SLT domain-containing protein [Streptomyces corynorhini]|uniref:transglycosylase SLT domain-containing protein n=1 Tax=Streptomyces corynorhini TaxID=2282652 RepID=UPI001F236EA4|nr:transglycosylase SLT domain-containing protein [Streptomyces corynorhini]